MKEKDVQAAKLLKPSREVRPLQSWAAELTACVLEWISLEDGNAFLRLRCVCRHWKNLIDSYLMPRRLLRLHGGDMDSLQRIQVRWPRWRLHVDYKGGKKALKLARLADLYSLDLSHCRWVYAVRSLNLSYLGMEDVRWPEPAWLSEGEGRGVPGQGAQPGSEHLSGSK